MLAALYCFVISLVLIAGSTQIDLWWLSWGQFLIGAYFAFAGAVTGWRAARED